MDSYNHRRCDDYSNRQSSTAVACVLFLFNFIIMSKLQYVTFTPVEEMDLTNLVCKQPWVFDLKFWKMYIIIIGIYNSGYKHCMYISLISIYILSNYRPFLIYFLYRRLISFLIVHTSNVFFKSNTNISSCLVYIMFIAIFTLDLINSWFLNETEKSKKL